MVWPKLAKISPFLIGCLTPVVVMGSWSAYDRFYPTTDAFLRSFQFVPSEDFSVDLGEYPSEQQPQQTNGVQDNNKNKFGFTREGICFNTFFGFSPDETKPAVNFTEKDNKAENELVPIAVTAKMKRDRKSPWSACSLMKLSQKQNDFLFKSEWAIKNNSHGFGLWMGIKKVNSDTISLQYYLILLLNRTGGYFEIVNGYSWQDQYIVKSRLDVEKLHISFPDNNEDLLVSNASTSQDKWATHEYSGIWKESKGGKGIFSGLNIHYQEQGSPKINWGLSTESMDEGVDKKDHIASSIWNKQPGDDSLKNYIYAKSKDGGWMWLSSLKGVVKRRAQRFETSLSELFDEFRFNKRGVWTGMRDYCATSKNKRRVTEEERYMILDLCYEPMSYGTI